METPCEEWVLEFPFNPNSPKQVLAYIRSQGHKVPKHEKTRNETTDKGELEKLAKRYPKDKLYKLIIEAREVEKQITTYIEGFTPTNNGRVHPIYTQNPSTGRLSACGPNIENVPRRARLARACRRQFIATQGKRFYEFDWRAVEALFVGWLAKDKVYMRAAKLGLHGIFASHLTDNPISLEWSDSDIEKAAKVIKRTQPILYDQAKHGGHGSNYLATAYKLHMEYPDLFRTIKDAEKIQNIYFQTIAKKVKAWQQATLAEAYQKCYLETLFGHRHYFYDIFVQRAGRTVYGQQAKDAVAYRPQSMVPFVLKDVVMRLGMECPGLWYWGHDALGFEWSEWEAQEWAPRVKAEMEAPIDKLSGLSIPVEIEVGKNWGDMEETELCK